MRRLLVVKRRVPAPVHIGSDAVTYANLVALSGAFDVTLIAVDENERSRTGARLLGELGISVRLARERRARAAHDDLAGKLLRNARRLAGGVPSELQRAACADLGPLIRQTCEQTRFDLAQFEYWTTAAHRRQAPCPAVLLNHDLWFQTATEIAARQRKRYRRWLWALEARTVKAHELRANALFEGQLFLSEADRRGFLRLCPEVSTTEVVPVCLPFPPAAENAVLSGYKDPMVLFIGAMNAPFNADAVAFFVADVWPRIRARVPDATFVIVGRDPAAEVRDLAAAPGVTVVGEVDDLGPWLAASCVAVSPARIGTGFKVKVAQAMAAGLPVVGTRAGVSGCEDAPGVVACDSPDQLAGEVIGILTDPARREVLARDALRHYREALWMETARSRMAAFYQRLVERLSAHCSGAA